jgi:hypothetical protein
MDQATELGIAINPRLRVQALAIVFRIHIGIGAFSERFRAGRLRLWGVLRRRRRGWSWNGRRLHNGRFWRLWDFDFRAPQKCD